MSAGSKYVRMATKCV